MRKKVQSTSNKGKSKIKLTCDTIFYEDVSHFKGEKGQRCSGQGVKALFKYNCKELGLQQNFIKYLDIIHIKIT